MKTYQVTVLPSKTVLPAAEGENLLSLLQRAGLSPDAPCGGQGKCGKCTVFVDGFEALSCQTAITHDITVQLPQKEKIHILTQGLNATTQPDGQNEYTLAYDIGTTTVVCYLLNGITGEELAKESALNPQTSYGADVISRIQYVMEHGFTALQSCITQSLSDLASKASAKAGITPDKITLASVVGNTAMHHLLLGIDPSPLTTPPLTCPKSLKPWKFPPPEFSLSTRMPESGFWQIS